MKWLIVGYLAAIVIANLTVAYFGPAVVIVNAFILIALDLTARDRLHELWHGQHLVRNMALLIATGSILSAALDYAALPVALASFCAFALSEMADTFVYTRLEAYAWHWKVNGSNVVSAAVDSVVFLSLLAALTDRLPWGLVPLLAFGQWGAKTVGGAIWGYVLNWHKENVHGVQI